MVMDRSVAWTSDPGASQRILDLERREQIGSRPRRPLSCLLEIVADNARTKLVLPQRLDVLNRIFGHHGIESLEN
jgi:hypothetical protein